MSRLVKDMPNSVASSTIPRIWWLVVCLVIHDIFFALGRHTPLPSYHNLNLLAGVKDPFIGNVIVKTIQLTAQLVSFYNIERFGRRRLLLIGGAGMTLMNLAIAIVGTPKWTPPGVIRVIVHLLDIVIWQRFPHHD